MKRIRTVVYGRFASEGSARTGKEDTSICERLRPHDFAVSKSSRYGFPYQPTCVAVDSVQGILAIGTYTGSLRILGRPGVEAHVQHESGTPVRNLRFLINEGALLSTCPEDSIHLWNLRQSQPVIVQSLRFNRERITCLHLPFTSKWMFVGTEKGNIHIVNIERFDVSGYTINWNKAIDIQCKTHPGPVVQISDNPLDSNKILLGYESGTVVLWSLRSKSAEQRFSFPQRSLTSFYWFNDGKQFICSHTDGTLSMWNIKCNTKATDTLCPHGKSGKERPCSSVTKVQWLSPASGEPVILFSGGTPRGKRKGLTLCQGKTTKLLSSETILDFTTILSSPWKEDSQIPRAVIAVTTSSLLVFDLMTSLAKPLTYDVPYTFDIHESPVTCTQYFSECPPDLINDIGSLGSRPKKRNLTRESSRQAWPIMGGVTGEQSDKPASELVITGHADGSVKFWDASSASLLLLYKMSTIKLFDREKAKSSEESSDSSERKPSTSESSESGDHSSQDEDPEAYSVQMINLCVHSRILVIAGAVHVLVMSFSMSEQPVELVQIDLHLTFEPATEQPSTPDQENTFAQPSDRESTSSPETTSYPQPVPLPTVCCKTGTFKRHPGFQAEVACVIASNHDGWPVSDISLSSQLGIISICSGTSLALVDIVQKKLITTLSAQEMTSLSECPTSAPPPTPVTATPITPATPGTPGTPISFTLNLEAGGGLDFSQAAINKLEKKKNKPARPAPPTRSKSIKSGDSSNGVDTSDGSGASRHSYPSGGDGGPPDTVQCTKFACTYTKKHDNWISPCLFVGTAKGNTFIVVINMPSAEERLKQPILTIITGTVFHPKSGMIMTIAVLDHQGLLFPSPLRFWTEKKDDRNSNKTVIAQECSDRHFAVICTEREAKVFQLPPTHTNPTCYSKTNIADDTSVVLMAEVISIEGSSCLVCLTSIGQLMAFSLPSLTTLMSAECAFLLTDFRFLRTLKFSEEGQAIVMCSPYELQKLSIFSRNDSLSETGTLFRALETPEKPSQGFFTSLFSSQPSPLDREQLFGKESGAASRSVAERVQGPGVEQLQEVSVGLAGAMQKNREALVERGEKLSQLDKTTAELSIRAQNFADVANQVTLKYKEKKWYQV